MSATNSVQNAVNYLVPSSGGTHLIPYVGVFTGTPFLIDWRQFSINEFPFQPQGVFVDNSQGAGSLVINIQPINWNITVAAGAVAQSQFPAPDGQTCTITGDGQATVVFVDFPVLPNAGAVTVIGTANVNVVSPDPLPVSLPVNNGGVPYQVNLEPLAVTTEFALAGATLVTTITPPANTYLRKLIMRMAGNTTAATAENLSIVVALNGIEVFTDFCYIPTIAPVLPGSLYEVDIDFDPVAPAVGAAGTLTVTLGELLTAGGLSVNAYFA
jgi:hypothetical protein